MRLITTFTGTRLVGSYQDVSSVFEPCSLEGLVRFHGDACEVKVPLNKVTEVANFIARRQ